jgi:Aspartyl protease
MRRLIAIQNRFDNSANGVPSYGSGEKGTRVTAKKRIILLLLVALFIPAAARAACVVESKAAISLQVTGGAIIVPVELNGMTASFILDSGAQRSVVTQDAVQRLGLARDQWVGTTMGGIGGIDRRPNADPHSFSLGGIPMVRRTVNHDTSLTVGVLPRPRAGSQVIDGLLGRDFLSLFDLDLDMPARRLTLYRVNGCSGRFLPWTGDYDAIPVTVPAGEAIVVPVMLDGRILRALLDTGASASLLGAPGMYRMGLEQANLTADPADRISGLGPRVVTAHRHQFRSMRVGNQTIDLPEIWVEPVRLTPIVDMLLGADWLAGRRVWISFTTKQLFVATR